MKSRTSQSGILISGKTQRAFDTSDDSSSIATEATKVRSGATTVTAVTTAARCKRHVACGRGTNPRHQEQNG
jgi:hypothetical protein